MNMRDFLLSVGDGKGGFHAEGNEVSDLQKFKAIVDIAEEAYELGFIDFYKPHIESYTGNRYCDAFLAANLTEEGRAYLAGS